MVKIAVSWFVPSMLAARFMAGTAVESWSISKSAARPTPHRPQVWKPAIRQTWKSALLWLRLCPAVPVHGLFEFFRGIANFGREFGIRAGAAGFAIISLQQRCPHRAVVFQGPCSTSDLEIRGEWEQARDRPAADQEVPVPSQDGLWVGFGS